MEYKRPIVRSYANKFMSNCGDGTGAGESGIGQCANGATPSSGCQTGTENLTACTPGSGGRRRVF